MVMLPLNILHKPEKEQQTDVCYISHTHVEERLKMAALHRTMKLSIHELNILRVRLSEWTAKAICTLRR